MEIEAITGAIAPAVNSLVGNGGAAVAGTPKVNFADWMKQAFTQVDALQQSADSSAQKVISGESEDVAGAMIEMEKANIAFNFVMQVRNKIISAYEEIQRMQL